jgi:hypothetical protein
MFVQSTHDRTEGPEGEGVDDGPLVRVERLLARPTLPAMDCDGCTACCTVMAVTELRKPGRRACDHIRRDGCRIYPERPKSCREFHCAWVRGMVGGGAATRPDELGVMFDAFIDRGHGAMRIVAFELWAGALEGPLARAIVEGFAEKHTVALSKRDGTWTTVHVHR